MIVWTIVAFVVLSIVLLLWNSSRQVSAFWCWETCLIVLFIFFLLWAIFPHLLLWVGLGCGVVFVFFFVNAIMTEALS